MSPSTDADPAPGSAKASRRAATLTPSPKMSSSSMMMSPRLTPMRKTSSSWVRSGNLRCTGSAPQAAAVRRARLGCTHGKRPETCRQFRAAAEPQNSVNQSFAWRRKKDSNGCSPCENSSLGSPGLQVSAVSLRLSVASFAREGPRVRILLPPPASPFSTVNSAVSTSAPPSRGRPRLLRLLAGLRTAWKGG